ncbi:MAG: hypothetical protein R3D34_18300 [Nitratireductor sp.]
MPFKARIFPIMLAICLFQLLLPNPAKAVDALQKLAIETTREASSSLECGSKCDHSVLADKTVQIAGSELRTVVVASIASGEDCHACAPQLSLFAYRQSEGKWDPVAQSIAATTMGSWGAGPEISVEPYSTNTLGLNMDAGYCGQGYCSEMRLIWFLRGTGFEEVGCYATGADNSGAVGENSRDLESWEVASVFDAKSEEVGSLTLVVTNLKNRKKRKYELPFSNGRFDSSSLPEGLKGNCDQ